MKRFVLRDREDRKDRLSFEFDLDSILEETRQKKHQNNSFSKDFSSDFETESKQEKLDLKLDLNCSSDCSTGEISDSSVNSYQNRKVDQISSQQIKKTEKKPKIKNNKSKMAENSQEIKKIKKAEKIDEKDKKTDEIQEIVDDFQVDRKKFDVNIDFEKQDLLIDKSLLYDENFDEGQDSLTEGDEEENVLKNFFKKENDLKNNLRYSFDDFNQEDDGHEEEDFSLSQSEVFEILKNNKKYLLKKFLVLIFAFLLSVGSIVMSFSQEIGFEKINVFAVGNLISLFLVSIGCCDVLINGFVCLFKRKSSFDTIVSFVYIFSVLQSSLVLVNGQISKLTGIYTPSLILILLFDVLSKHQLHRLMKRKSRYISLFKDVKSVNCSNFKNVLNPEQNKISCFSQDLLDTKDNLLCLSNLQCGKQVSNMYIYIILFLSLVIFGFSFLINNDLYLAVSSLCCVLIGMVPLSKDFCFKFIVNRLSKKLFRKEILLYKYSAIDKIKNCDRFVIDNDEFFAKDDFKLIKMKIFDNKQINSSIVYISSLLRKADSSISKVFMDIIGNKESMLKDVKNIKLDENFGLTGFVCENIDINKNISVGINIDKENDEEISGKIEEKEVVFGTSDYLLDSNIVIPSKYINLSRSILEDRTLKTLYVAIDGILTAMFLIKITPSKEIADALKSVTKNNLKITLNLKDVFITADDVIQIYGINKELVSEISVETKRNIESKNLGILHTGKLSGLTTSIVETMRTRQFFDVTFVLEIVGMILTGCLVVTFIALNSISYITFARLMLIQLFWFLIVFLVPNTHK